MWSRFPLHSRIPGIPAWECWITSSTEAGMGRTSEHEDGTDESKGRVQSPHLLHLSELPKFTLWRNIRKASFCSQGLSKAVPLALFCGWTNIHSSLIGPSNAMVLLPVVTFSTHRFQGTPETIAKGGCHASLLLLREALFSSLVSERRTRLPSLCGHTAVASRTSLTFSNRKSRLTLVGLLHLYCISSYSVWQSQSGTRDCSVPSGLIWVLWLGL